MNDNFLGIVSYFLGPQGTLLIFLPAFNFQHYASRFCSSYHCHQYSPFSLRYHPSASFFFSPLTATIFLFFFFLPPTDLFLQPRLKRLFFEYRYNWLHFLSLCESLIISLSVFSLFLDVSSKSTTVSRCLNFYRNRAALIFFFFFYISTPFLSNNNLGYKALKTLNYCPIGFTVQFVLLLQLR
ncbi:unnamed protein product [Acanthosepion pharaonis]|uniref:Uncharacterized protein n=1 Tax=Acanthosepion pharaonis TaxID=158019 RepID=A0A812BLY1_ACAPH|nr:unnamed protein product [Sepia pharaonis]